MIGLRFQGWRNATSPSGQPDQRVAPFETPPEEGGSSGRTVGYPFQTTFPFALRRPHLFGAVSKGRLAVCRLGLHGPTYTCQRRHSAAGGALRDAARRRRLLRANGWLSIRHDPFRSPRGGPILAGPSRRVGSLFVDSASTDPRTLVNGGTQQRVAPFETPPEEGGSSGRTVGYPFDTTLSVHPEEAPSLRGRLEGSARCLSTRPPRTHVHLSTEALSSAWRPSRRRQKKAAAQGERLVIHSTRPFPFTLRRPHPCGAVSKGRLAVCRLGLHGPMYTCQRRHSAARGALRDAARRRRLLRANGWFSIRKGPFRSP